MKKLALTAAAGVTLFALSACDDGGSPSIFDTSDDGSGTVDNTTPSTSDASSRDTSPSNNTTSQPWQEEQKKPASTATTKPKYPKGISVANKKGFVKSPYAEYEGLVDVRGFPSGTLVKCPYTSKIFVVP
ncbi:MAG: hypothetical protein AAGK14_12700 [Verrucomicrobiota bacterium]